MVESSNEQERAIMISENKLWRLNEYLALNLKNIIEHLNDIPHEKAKEAMYAYGFFINTVKTIDPRITGETVEEKVISDYLEAKKKEQESYWEDETQIILEKQ